MENFHFIRPYWMLAALPLLWLLWRTVRASQRSNQWQRVVDPALLANLVDDNQSPASRQPILLVGVLWLAALIALAGPSWEKQQAPVYRGLSERVLVVDLSLSMNAADVKPSRIARVRQKLSDILDRSGETQTALVVYSAVPYIVSPLTDDVQTIRSMLPSLATNIIPAQGSRTSLALKMAQQLLSSAGSRNGSIWLFTDSPVDSGADSVAESIRSDGYQLSIIGAGTAEGAPIANSSGGFVKDRNGNIVIVKLAASPLRELAATGGGTYTTLTTNDDDIAKLFAYTGNGLPPSIEGIDEDAEQRQTEIWLERGPWILLLLTPLTALIFRRGCL
ncbi:hypothetical protein AB833_06700 [Chromatiales bacterium (ex Bugula neritina AB1)]|nr:hypothetical protein AB833_06700 [Chromatiales bacterium (ex Bugula neritina AB1)]